MKKKKVFTVLLYGILAMITGIGFTQSACAAQWYPFYGYRQPAYLASPSVVVVQPSAPTVQNKDNGSQAYTTYYRPPEATTVLRAASSRPAYATSGQWYPFYGYRRPAYLGR